MTKILPYEAKGKLIREMKVTNLDEATKLKEMFLQENDKWLKKMLAMRLLEFDNLESLKLNKNDLLNFTKWQIEL